MPSPIRPSDLKSTLASTDDPVCSRLKKVLVDFPKAVYAWFSYIYNEDGTFTKDFKDEICAVDCETLIIDDPPEPCDPESDPDCEPVDGILSAPRLSAGVAMRHRGGIPLVWPHVDGARSYSLYRGTTSDFSAATTVLIRKGLIWTNEWKEDRNRLFMRIANNSLLFVDVNGGLAWDEDKQDHIPSTNTLNSGSPYYYWVRGVDANGLPGQRSDRVLAFSKTVTNFDTLPSATFKLLWSGETDTPSGLSGKTKMRVTLRSGAGAGGGGGDYVLPVYSKFHMTAIAHDDSTGDTTVTVNIADHGFVRGTQITIEENKNTNWNHTWTVSEQMDGENSNKFKIEPLQMQGIGSPTGLGAAGTLPDDPSISHYGTVYAANKKNRINISGGGGGAGGVVQAVFTVEDLLAVRVRTYGINGELVNYLNGGMAVPGPDKAKKDDPRNSNDLNPETIPEKIDYFPFNQGGRGRNDSTNTVGVGVGPPTPGEPSSDDKHGGDDAPYITVLEVTDDNTNWNPILWVSDGEGGGYRNAGGGSNLSTGGASARPIWWKADKFGGNSTTSGSGASMTGALAIASVFKAVETLGWIKAQFGYKNFNDAGGGSATLRTAALDGKGIVFYAGADGADAHAGDPVSGFGGNVWDGLMSKQGKASSGATFGYPFYTQAGSRGSSLDLKSPGSGGGGSSGTGDPEMGRFAWGGHALAGCAYVLYATTDYDAV